jgi:hypothetical protein
MDESMIYLRLFYRETANLPDLFAPAIALLQRALNQYAVTSSITSPAPYVPV